MSNSEDTTFRAFKARERGLLERLLDCEFQGRDQLRLQLNSTDAKQVDEDGTLLLRCDTSSAAPVKFRVPVEGMCTDADGVGICILLHVKDGFMHMLEIIKDDGSPILNPPNASDLVVY